MTLLDTFLLVGLPYLALAAAVIAGWRRLRHSRYSLSARSSQFLEDRQLLWGSAPWHIGIGVVLLGHLAALFFPRLWSGLMASHGVLVAVETIGAACGWLAVAGLLVLLARRLTSARVQAVTTVADVIVVVLLLAQVVLGLGAAAQFRYGAAWCTGTVVPYVWSLLRLQPDAALVADLPPLLKLHIVGAWLLVLLLPFTRLLHLLAVPLAYLWRAPQRVVWTTTRRNRQAAARTLQADSRRAFLKGAVGVAGAGGLLAIGVSEKALGFFRGPRPDPEAEAALLQKKLQRLQQTAEERALELERRTSAAIFVARYADLAEQKGKYFIAYDMAPGLAFKGKDGMPVLWSAKCTHLGCTVGSDVDAQGRVLCPCHISYFDVATGMPNEGAPAKLPLPALGWALTDAAGNVVASAQPGEAAQGARDPAVLAACSLYITKPGGGA